MARPGAGQAGGTLRATGHPHGGRGRPRLCIVCRGYFLATLGTIFHGPRVAPALMVRVIACGAEGLGIRGTARGFAGDPQTVLQGWVEAPEPLQAFSRHVLHAVRLRQGQLEALLALLRAVKDHAGSAAEAIERLERTPQGVWVALDPERKVRLALDVGARTLVMAQCVVHHVAQGGAPDGAPLWRTEGLRAYLTALLTPCGSGVHPQRRQATGPLPPPRGRPRPPRLSAQVVTTVRRQRLVRVSPRVVFGPLEAVAPVLSACGWPIKTAFVARLHLDIRPRVAAVGRRVTTRCKGEDGGRQQRAFSQTYHNFGLPHGSVRQPWAPPEPTNGPGGATQGRPWPPAMAGGLSDHIWTLRALRLLRVPPGPQPQAL